MGGPRLPGRRYGRNLQARHQSRTRRQRASAGVHSPERRPGTEAAEARHPGRRNAFGKRLGRPARRWLDVPLRPLDRRSNLPGKAAVQPAMHTLIAASLITLSFVSSADSARQQSSAPGVISGTWRSRLSESWVRQNGERWVSLELQAGGERNYGSSIRLSELD